MAAGHLTLNGATIDGGVVSNAGRIDLTGTDSVKNGSLSILAGGVLNVSGGATASAPRRSATPALLSIDGTLTTTGGSLHNTATIAITGSATLHDEAALDASTPVNTGTIEVKAGGTLTLDQATDINGTGT